jgi:hypothetical protein
MDREARSWRRLALAGAGSTALLLVRLFVSPQTPLYRLTHPEFWPPDKARLLRRHDGHGESRDEELERRLRAVEIHLQNLPPKRGM